jgi:adenylate cyclase
VSIAIQTTTGFGEAHAAVSQLDGAKQPNALTDTGISPEAVRAQLDKILSSPTFVRSRRLGRFLRFTIEQALEGRQATLKEYLVGVEVFNKMESFDPRIDSIVRVEARRLRSKLEHYYQTEGADDPIVIQFLKGSYVPLILHRDQLPPLSRTPAAEAEKRSSIAVAPFANLSSDPGDHYFCSGLTEDLISALTKLDRFRVMARPASLQNGAAEVRPDLMLEGSMRRHGDRLRISAQLIDVDKGVYVWSDTYDCDTTDVFAVQEEVSRSIVSALSARPV